MWRERCFIMCSCKDDIVAFYCNEEQCSNNKVDPLYCAKCAIEGERHDHRKPPWIIDKITDLDAAWTALKESLNKINGKAT